MKNWRTTVLGMFGGITMAVKGYLIKDMTMVTSGLSMALMGFLAKDAGVSGTAK